MAIKDDVLLSWHDSIVELFELDLTPITTGVGANKFYFTNQTDSSGNKLRWKATGSGATLVTYEPLPIVAEGFDRGTKGQIPRPTMTVANIFNTFTEALGELDDLVGAKVVRRRTLAKYLGGMPTADLNSEFPTDIFFIERKIAENNQLVSFELSSALDLEGLELPKRIITQNYCIWDYRGAECGYAGPPVAGVDDGPPVPSGTTSSHPAVVAYVTASAALGNSRRDLSRAQAAYNIALNRRTVDCSTTGGGDSQFNLGSATAPGFVPIEWSFALCSGSSTNPLMIMWRGAFKTAADTNYVASTTRFSSTLNKPMYEVRKQLSATVSGTRVIDPLVWDVSSRSRATFAFQDDNGNWLAVWSGQYIASLPDAFSGLGVSYSRGGQRLTAATSIGPLQYAKELDPAIACSTATAALAVASGSLVTASGAYVAAQAAFVAASGALISSGLSAVISGADICGKRVSSCRLRFPTSALPFGGFPGANTPR